MNELSVYGPVLVAGGVLVAAVVWLVSARILKNELDDGVVDPEGRGALSFVAWFARWFAISGAVSMAAIAVVGAS